MLSTLAHLFHPQESNNHRPRIIHPAGLAVLVGIFLLINTSLGLVKVWGRVGQVVLGYMSSITAEDIVAKTNAERLTQGLPTLTVNSELTQAATLKAQNMFNDQYWAHTSPSGTTPWVFIKDAGYNYSVAGENLARDFADTSSVVRAWMTSPTHRANIVSDKYQDIGVAVVEGSLDGVETTLVVQMFGTRTSALAQTSPTAVQTPNAPLPQTVEKLTLPQPETKGMFSQAIATTQTGLSSVGRNVNKIVVSPLLLTQAVATAIVVLLVLVLAYDALLAYRRRTVRLVGKNWAHLGFFAVILTLIYAITQGTVL